MCKDQILCSEPEREAFRGLLLASAPLAARRHHSDIDTGPRRAERPSDHAPVIAGFEP
jgi:exonuclease III